jgi:U3 small nucleolar RNA-associated protein 5
VGLQRYAEGASVAVKRGGMLEDASDDDAPGALDADLAELSLGQRLATLPGGPAPSSSSDDEEGEGMPAGPSRRRRKAKTTDGAAPPPPATLTRTLTQALHSGDAGLLEACLAHAQPALVAASVARLPPALALPLLDACVARMGRAGAQRAGALGTWVRAALGAHGASLLADPLAVARLAGTHAVLAQRAALRDGLEALQGRLETALAQVELGRARVRREGTAATAPGKEKRQPTHYVEGESTDEEEDEDEDVLLEQNEDAASVEEVELGGSDDESDDDDDDDESGEEDDDDEGGVLNGFVDDEAEEYSGESEEDESD